MLINATSLSKYWGGWWHREFMPAIWWPNDVCNLWLRQSHRQTFCFRSNLFDFLSLPFVFHFVISNSMMFGGLQSSFNVQIRLKRDKTQTWYCTRFPWTVLNVLHWEWGNNKNESHKKVRKTKSNDLRQCSHIEIWWSVWTQKKESFDLIQSLLPVVTVTQVISIVILSHRDVYFSNLLAEIQ